MELITVKEFIILIFQMLFLIFGLCFIYSSIKKDKYIHPHKDKFILLDELKYIKSKRILSLIIGILTILVSILSLLEVISFNITGILFGTIILTWTGCDYYINSHN